MPYSPGLHILAEFTSNQMELLSKSEKSKYFFDALIVAHELKTVGAIYHDFEGAGFTAAICLTESHLSIHTWPEYNLATFDIFLSNYQKDNTEKVKAIYQAVLTFFEGVEIQKTELKR